MISLMLEYIKDEEDVFWCLHKIMLENNWRQYYVNNMPRMHYAHQRVEAIFGHSFPEICKRLDTTEMYAICNSIATNLIMSIFTSKVPVWISKRCFEFYLWKDNGEDCLFDLLESVLVSMRDKMQNMETGDLEMYLIHHKFVEDCFNEAKGTDNWIHIFKYQRKMSYEKQIALDSASGDKKNAVR